MYTVVVVLISLSKTLCAGRDVIIALGVVVGMSWEPVFNKSIAVVSHTCLCFKALTENYGKSIGLTPDSTSGRYSI